MRPSHTHALSALMKLLITLLLVVLLFNPAIPWQAVLIFLSIVVFFVAIVIITYENFELGIRKRLAQEEDNALLGIDDEASGKDKKDDSKADKDKAKSKD